MTLLCFKTLFAMTTGWLQINTRNGNRHRLVLSHFKLRKCRLNPCMYLYIYFFCDKASHKANMTKYRSLTNVPEIIFTKVSQKSFKFKPNPFRNFMLSFKILCFFETPPFSKFPLGGYVYFL